MSTDLCQLILLGRPDHMNNCRYDYIKLPLFILVPRPQDVCDYCCKLHHRLQWYYINDITSCAWLILSGSRCNYPSWGFTIILHRTINIRLETILRNNYNVMVYMIGIGTIDENVVWFPLMLDLIHCSSDTRSMVTTIMHCVTMAGLSICLLSTSKRYFAN